MLTLPRHTETAWARPLVFAAAALSTTLWAYACGDGATAPPPPTPDPPRATSLAVTPSTAQLAALGSTVQPAAEVRDQNGNVMGGAAVSWSSGNTSVATVDGSGLVTAAGSGTATITATAGQASGTASVTVANPDRAALVALYNATAGPNWVDNTHWLTDAPLGEWYGVTTDVAGRVVVLDLAGQWDQEAQRYVKHGLAGEIPPELGDLANLTELWLQGNALTGTVPESFLRISGLIQFFIGSNASLCPSLPISVGHLAPLELLKGVEVDGDGRGERYDDWYGCGCSGPGGRGA